jgi:hypothetical protein
MFILDSLLVGGIRFVLEKVAAAAEAELHDDAALREQLLEAQMRLELGELSAEEFSETERDILARIREVKDERPGGLTIASADVKLTGVDVETY